MSDLRIPRHLARTVAQRGSTGERWVSALPSRVRRLARAWSLVVGEPYEPGGGTSWTAPARRTTDDAPLVLKIGMRDPECLHEPDGLRAWDGSGAVRLQAASFDEDTSALLVERCEPGTELRRALPEPEQDVVVAALLRRLWIPPADGHVFRPLSDMCDLWAAECEERLDACPPRDSGLAREGLALWRELATKGDRTVLLVTDLHAGNILAARREPWLVVDPKPYVGDPAYDPMQHMTNCAARLAADPRGLCDRMANLTEVDPARLRAWMFARLTVDRSWPFENDRHPGNDDVARALAP